MNTNLPGIANGSAGDFSATIYFNDLMESNRGMYLRFKLNGMFSFEVNGATYFNSFEMDGGDQQTFSLNSFFNSANVPQLLNLPYNQSLRSGGYTMEIAVYDLFTNQQISNKAFHYFSVNHTSAPMLFPLSPGGCGASVTGSNTVNVLWRDATPVYDYSITHYLEWVSLEIDASPPMDRMQFQSFYINSVEVVGGSFIFQNFSFDSIYVFWVKAVAKDGDDVVDNVIENNGYSNICWFKYYMDQNAPCTEVTSLRVVGGVKSNNVTIQWDAENEIADQKYDVGYRLAGSTVSYVVDTTSLKSYKITKLEPETSYEINVSATCISDPFYVSEESLTITTPRSGSEFRCGEDISFDPLTLDSPLDSLKIGDSIKINSLTIFIDKVISRCGKGCFNGEGRITFALPIPLIQDYTPGVRVKFENLYIDKNKQVVAGYVQTVYDAANWDTQIINFDALDKGGKFRKKLMDTKFGADVTINGVIASKDNIITTPEKNGNGDTIKWSIVVNYTSGGIPISTPAISKDTTAVGSYIIKDSDNMYYGVDLKTGEVVELGKFDPNNAAVLAAIRKDSIQFPDRMVTFSASPDAKYAFDRANMTGLCLEFTKMYEYEPYKVTKADPGKGSYPLCWKFIPPGITDKVLATLPATLPVGFEWAKLKFITTNQTEISYDSIAARSGSITLSLPGGSDGAEYSLHAVYNTTSGWKQIGRVDVMSRSLKTFNVVIVPVEADIAETEITKMQSDLNVIYDSYGVQWNVTVNNNFNDSIDKIQAIVPEYQLIVGDAFLK